MDSIAALREMVEASGLTHRQIARRLGRYDAYVSQVLARSGTPGADTIASIASACGYRLELVPMDGGRTITIGRDEDQGDDAPTMERARAMIARGLAMLDQLDG